ncbi:MAG: adenylate/guanylate cyclase domain-containing protein, partial [Solirubrobacteraceae bacterium]|nr:adenylate/guanylate cyclase domain-containing protein [Solirubrobacteraceae bacterium]
AIVLALNLLVIPGNGFSSDEVALRSMLIIGVYVVFAFATGTIVIFRHSDRIWIWLREGRPPTADEETQVLRSPLYALGVLVVLWVLATFVSTAVTIVDSGLLGLRVFITTLLGGITTSAFGYVLTERAMRPASQVVLTYRTAASPTLPGASTRQLLTWAVGTGSPVFGLWILGVLLLAGAIPGTSADKLAIVMVVLSSITLTAGLLAEFITARAVADPVTRMRRAVQRVADGDLTARVPIDDATEIGLLQAGFNRMATGIQEREELRDLFGRHVGGEVAETALKRGIELGGETLQVGAMFVDVVGSTALAMARPATEVVELINRFFDVVIDVTQRHGGLVNKFAGDGALIVFGAPVPQSDYATRALRAARELAIELERLAPDTPATMGVSGGDVIAGNMGSSKRFEYTVMGDPVNEAARLGAQAGALPHRVAVSGRLYELADAEEQVHWRIDHSLVLRGRSERTDVVVMIEEGDEPGPASTDQAAAGDEPGAAD